MFTVCVRKDHGSGLAHALERAAVQALIRAKGLDEVVHLAGYCGDMSANLGRFDYYVHPAIAEGMPYAVVEAMAAGLPVVATDVGGTSELIERGVNRIFIPPATRRYWRLVSSTARQLRVCTQSGRRRARTHPPTLPRGDDVTGRRPSHPAGAERQSLMIGVIPDHYRFAPRQ